MTAFITVLVLLFVFAGVVISLLYVPGAEKLTGLPNRHPFYLFLGFLLIAALGLFIAYELGVIEF